MIPNWLWRSQDPIGFQVRVPRRHSERARPMDDDSRLGINPMGAKPMGTRPMGARPMGADLWALDAWA